MSKYDYEYYKKLSYVGETIEQTKERIINYRKKHGRNKNGSPRGSAKDNKK